VVIDVEYLGDVTPNRNPDGLPIAELGPISDDE